MIIASGELPLATIFIDVAIIVVVARLMGALFRRIGQPAVVGEILAGIALGPSLLGLVPGSWFGLTTSIPQWMFPLEVRPYLKVLAELGLIIFMFIVGLELDVKLIRGRERVAATISISSIILPFGLGMLLAGALYGSYNVVNGTTVEFLPFALFMGIAMSITAFPVLARILTERGMHRTPVGAMALASAAVDDIVAWSLLAFVLAVVQSAGGGGVTSLLRILALSIVFVAVMFGVVRPLLAKLVPWYERAGRLTPDLLSVVIVGFLVCSYLTDKIGIHTIFGAFVFGAVMPREGAERLTHDILERLEQVSVLLLLPVFFIATGLNVDITGLRGSGLVALLLVLLVAISGKFVGATLAARFSGMSWTRAGAVGTLMNTRGLTELVVLNIGLAAGVLNTELFTILVCMAIITTVMTAPLLRVFYPDRILRRDIAEAERAALGVPDAYRVVVAVGEVDDAIAVNLVDTAIALVGAERPSEIVLCRFQPQDQKLEIGTGMGGELGSFTDSLGALHDLTTRVDAVDIPCTVRSQFTIDPVGELLALADAVFADVVLVPGGDPTGADSSRPAPDPRFGSDPADCTIVTVWYPGRPMLVEGDTEVRAEMTGAETDAVIDVAARLAHSQRAPLSISGDDRAVRRARSATDGIAGHLEVRSAHDMPPLATVSDGDPAAVAATHGPVLIVRGAPNAGDRLRELTDRLST